MSISTNHKFSKTLLTKIYSFDIFDTILTRVFYKPEDVFFFLEKHLKRIKLIDSDMDFAKLRIKSENIARSSSINEEIKLIDIYQEFQKSTFLSSESIKKIIENELLFEEFSLSVIEKTKNKLDHNSIIISDIYLDLEFIASLFQKLSLPYHKIYLSSEYGVMKHYSTLYKVVIEDLGVKGSQLIHVGDNSYSDVKMANKMRIESNHFKLSQPTRYEEIVYNIKNHERLESILAGSMRASRLSQHFTNVHEQTIWNIATDVIGPFTFLYTYWILEQAKKRNIETLFFIARDGHIMYQIAKKISKHFSHDIELKYLYGSRKAFHLPSITEIGATELNWIFDQTEFLSVQSICSRLELGSSKIRSFVVEIGINDFEKNLLLKERNCLKELFASNTFIHKLILSKAKERRVLVGEYLKQEGFDSSKNLGIVDIGWRGRQQKSLSKILDIMGLYPENGLNGIYLSLRDSVEPYKLDEMFTFFPYEQNPELILYHSLYEVFVSADHGSCIGYTKKGHKILPLLREEENTQLLKWGLKVHQKGILDFSDMFLQTCNFVNIDHVFNCQEISKALLEKFLKYPEEEEAHAYGKVFIFEDQEEEVSYGLTQMLSTKDLFFTLFRPSSVFHENSWREGSYAISVKGNKILFQKIYQKVKTINNYIHKYIRREQRIQT